MPVKKGKTQKKRNPSSDADDLANYQIDIQYNPDIIEGLIKDLTAQIETKCAQIQSDSDFMVSSIQQAFHLELIKLPNQVKQMSVRRFKEEFGDSLEAVTRGAMLGNNINSKSNFSTASKMNAKAYQTPSHSYKGGGSLIGQTPRLPREGEMIVSANGSPLGEFCTVKKAPRDPATNSIIPPTPGVFVPLSSGEVLDIEKIDINNMSSENKEETIKKMQSVMDNMQSLMAKLSQPAAFN